MDLHDFIPTETSVIQLRHPAKPGVLLMTDEKKPQPMTVEIYGSDTRVYKKAKAAFDRSVLKRSQGRDKNEEISDGDYDFFEQAERDLLLACTKSVHLKIGGKIVTDPNEFYADANLSKFHQQVQNAINNVGNFIKA